MHLGRALLTQPAFGIFIHRPRSLDYPPAAGGFSIFVKMLSAIFSNESLVVL
jgi:hypothetical protein